MTMANFDLFFPTDCTFTSADPAPISVYGCGLLGSGGAQINEIPLLKILTHSHRFLAVPCNPLMTRCKKL